MLITKLENNNKKYSAKKENRKRDGFKRLDLVLVTQMIRAAGVFNQVSIRQRRHDFIPSLLFLIHIVSSLP